MSICEGQKRYSFWSEIFDSGRGKLEPKLGAYIGRKPRSGVSCETSQTSTVKDADILGGFEEEDEDENEDVRCAGQKASLKRFVFLFFSLLFERADCNVSGCFRSC